LKSVGALVLLLAASAVAALAQDVTTEYDHQSDFRSFHTYDWQNVAADDQSLQPRITEAVDRTLRSKGWHRVDAGGAVPLVVVVGARAQQYQTDPVGTIVVDVYEAQSKRLIWHGTASDSSSNAENANLERAIDKMFRDFPPQ